MFVGAPTADPRSDQQIVASIDGDQQTEDDDGDKQVEEENTGGGGNVDTGWVG